MWQTRCDVEHFPAVTPHILSVQVLDSGDEQKKGLKWRESRLYLGRETTSIITLTDVVAEKPHHYCATYNICYVGENWDTQQANQTGTFTIWPLEEDPQGCWLLFTVNFVADGIMALWIKAFGCCLKCYLLKYLNAELEDSARVARAVQRERNKNKKADTVQTPPIKEDV